MKLPIRYTASSPKVKSTRFLSSGTANRFLIAFLDYASTSAVPPAALIFSSALPLNLCARTVSFLLMSPRASTLTFLRAPPMRPRSSSSSGVTSDPVSNTSAIVSRFTTAYSMRNGLWNPRFGMRRCSGIWPPSNPRLCVKPERDFAPLWPRPAVLPLPEPCPRPTRFFECFAPLGGFKPVSDIALSNLHEVTDLVDHAARRRRVDDLDRVIDAAEAEALHRGRLRLVEADRADDQRDRHFLAALLRRFLSHWRPPCLR